MSKNIVTGCVVSTKFVTSDSKKFSGYIDYIDRENAVRNNHISDFCLYTEYMDNPEKTTDLFTENSNHLSYEMKQNYKALYEKAQANGSPMWQTVISFDNRWLEKNGMYNSEEGFLALNTLMNYTRNAVRPMLEKEGLETAVWTAAVHYNTDNLHIHIATVEPTPTRKKVTVKTIRFPADWVKNHDIIRDNNLDIGKRVAAHKNINFEYRNIHKRITDILSDQGYNTRLLGDYITINSNGSVDLSYNGENNEIPPMAKLIDEHMEFRGTFKGTSIKECKRKMVNQIMDNSVTNERINKISRKTIALSMKGDILFENRDIVKQFLSVYQKLPEQRNNWKYGMNKIAKLRPEIDKITEMYISKYKTDEFKEFQSLLSEQAALYGEAYGGEGDFKRIKNKTAELYKNCGNAILSQMKKMSLRDLHELESNSYIAAEIEEAALTGEELDFDGRISYKRDSDGNQNNYWNDRFKQARSDLAEAVTLPDEYKQPELDRILNIFTNEAENGNDIAAYELGRYYKLGTFGSIDPELSSEYFYMAFSGFSDKLDSNFWMEPMMAASEFGKNYPNASPKEIEKEIFNLTKTAERNEWLYDYLTYRKGRMLLNGEGCKKNIPDGISYLEESSSPFAAYTLGNLYYYGKDDIAPDYQKAYTHFSDAAFPGSGESPMPFALYNMAEMIEKELIKETSFSANDLYSRALSGFISTDNENPNDMMEYRIASMLLDGKGCETDKERAEEYLIKSSEFGNTYAQTKLANLYLSSKKPEDAKTAVFLLQIAAASGNDIAQYTLGKIYLNQSTEYFDVDKGLKFLEESAQHENSFAEYTLGKVYYEDDIVKRDIETAMKHLETSAGQNNQFAQYMLGMIYLNGEDDLIEISVPDAVKYLSSAAEQGNHFAGYQLGKLYLENKDIKNIETALAYLKSADDRENPYLQYNLGRIYLENEDIRDIRTAVEHLTASADKKNPFAAYALGRLFSEDEYIQSDEEVSAEWYTKAYKEFSAIEQNPDIVTDDSVLYHLGIMNYKGLGTEKKINAAVDYLLKAAQNDYEAAQYQLGKIYLEDDGIKRNAEYAVQWLQKSADKGNQYAQYLLGKTLIDDSSVQDIPKAVEYLTKSAEQNNQFAQYALGKIYYNDDYGMKNIYQSLIYFTDSANQNNPFAQYQLGIIYYKGDEVEQEPELAIDYLNRSAEQRNPFAQYTLGIIYLKGELCESNINKAIEYFEKSAKQDNQFAQYQLGKIYYFGTEEIEQNRELGIEYLTKSANQGNEYALALLNWKPVIYPGFLHKKENFNETMIFLSSDMRQLFEHLSNEHDHMLNQMIHQKLQREENRENNQIQQ